MPAKMAMHTGAQKRNRMSCSSSSLVVVPSFIGSAIAIFCKCPLHIFRRCVAGTAALFARRAERDKRSTKSKAGRPCFSHTTDRDRTNFHPRHRNTQNVGHDVVSPFLLGHFLMPPCDGDGPQSAANRSWLAWSVVVQYV